MSMNSLVLGPSPAPPPHSPSKRKLGPSDSFKKAVEEMRSATATAGVAHRPSSVQFCSDVRGGSSESTVDSSPSSPNIPPPPKRHPPPKALLLRRQSTVYTSADTRAEQRSIVDDCIHYLLYFVSIVVMIIGFPLSMIACFSVVREYERAVVFRLGRLKGETAQGPGLIFTLPCIDKFRKLDLRVISFDVPPQEILSKDSVTVSVDGVVYFRISDPVIAVTNVNDYFQSTRLLAQTSLRNILGTQTLSEMLQNRDHIAVTIEKTLEEATIDWGVKVERVEVKDIRLPGQLMRAMAAEAEATREARAKIVAADGEFKASHALKEAADVIMNNPQALQLRYLQALDSIAAEYESTIIFPIPIDLGIVESVDVEWT